MSHAEYVAAADAVIAICDFNRSVSRAPTAFTACRPGTPTLIMGTAEPASWPASVESFLRKHLKWSSQKLAVLAPDDADMQPVLEVCSEQYQRARISQHTVEQRGVTWARHFMQTLLRAPAWASSVGEPWLGRPAFVVGAGPSLDKAGPLLREAQTRGPVVAVNTSATAVLAHGVVPDVVVCCESLDLRTHLQPLSAHPSVTTVLEATANPANWAACRRTLGFVSHEPTLVPYAVELGTVPLAFRGSVSCAAVALAIQWGADPIVLLGQDCAYPGDRMYARGTPFEDIRVEVRAGCIFFDGQSKQREPEPVQWVDGWGGTKVASAAALDAVLHWLGSPARASGARVWNASEGGAMIAGARHATLQDLLGTTLARCASAPALPALALPPPVDTSALRAKMVSAARDVLAGDLTSPPPSLPLLHLWAIPTLLQLREGLRIHQRLGAMRESMERGCREIIEVLG